MLIIMCNLWDLFILKWFYLIFLHCKKFAVGVNTSSLYIIKEQKG